MFIPLSFPNSVSFNQLSLSSPTLNDAIFVLQCMFSALFVFVILLMLIYTRTQYHARFTMTQCEYSLMLLHKLLDTRVTFTSYFTAKFIQSLLFFLAARYRIKSIRANNSPPADMCYVLGFPHDRWQTAMRYGKGEGHDSVSLAPPIVNVNKVTNVSTSSSAHGSCGFAFPGYESSDLNSLLYSCGRCLNRAIITCYHLAIDKFFTLSILTFLRWDIWILAFVFFVVGVCQFAFSLLLRVGSYVDVLGYFCDFFFLTLLLLDTFIMNSSKLIENESKREKKSSSAHLKYWKAFVLFIIYATYYTFVPFGPTLQFFLLLTLIATTACFLRRVPNESSSSGIRPVQHD